MADIIVTIPKDQESHYRRDKAPGFNKAFWNLSRRPKHLHVYDEIYFVLNGKITFSAEVREIEENPITCELTKKVWKGCQIWFSDVIELTPPLQPMIGFRGFRYYRGGQ